MPPHNFTAIDLAGTLIALLLFGPVLIAPGYVIAWIVNLFRFRTLDAPWRFVLSLPLSIALCPIVIYLLDLVYTPLVWAGFAASWIAFAALWCGGFGHPSLLASLPRFRVPVAAVLIATTWTTIAVGSLIDLQIDDRLDTSIVAFDHTLRTAMTDAITRTGFSHPANPYYYIHKPANLRYHYFWFMLCSVVDQLGGSAVDARQALIASVAWCGLGLLCIILAFLRWFDPAGENDLARRGLIGAGLLAVTGLDLIPNLVVLFRRHAVLPEMEWWNEQITSWAGSLLWVPNHVGALIAGLACFLILWYAAREQDRMRALALSVLAGGALTTTLGCSIYVGFVFALILTVWTVVTFFSGWRSHTYVLVIAGVVSICMAIPYVRQLSGAAAGGPFAIFATRAFPGANIFFALPEFSQRWKTEMLNLALLPLNYFFELGLFLIGGVVQIVNYWKAGRWTPEIAAGICLAGVSIAVCTFLRSATQTGNDLGWRGFLPAQFVLLLWTVDWLWSHDKAAAGWNKLTGFALAALVFIGLAGTIYEVVLLRFLVIESDVNAAPAVFSADHNLGKRMMGAREVYERLKAVLPRDAVVQSNPDIDIDDIAFGLYANRQTALGGRGCGTPFGGSMEACREVFTPVANLFRSPSVPEAEVTAVCRKLGIKALVVQDTDPVWRLPGSWICKMQPLAANRFARAYLIDLE